MRKVSFNGMPFFLISVNQRQLSHYINGTSRSPKQMIEKIVKALHRFAEELSQINFS